MSILGSMAHALARGLPNGFCRRFRGLRRFQTGRVFAGAKGCPKSGQSRSACAAYLIDKTDPSQWPTECQSECKRGVLLRMKIRGLLFGVMLAVFTTTASAQSNWVGQF